MHTSRSPRLDVFNFMCLCSIPQRMRVPVAVYLEQPYKRRKEKHGEGSTRQRNQGNMNISYKIKLLV